MQPADSKGGDVYCEIAIGRLRKIRCNWLGARFTCVLGERFEPVDLRPDRRHYRKTLKETRQAVMELTSEYEWDW
jgi:hypothetical protein